MGAAGRKEAAYRGPADVACSLVLQSFDFKISKISRTHTIHRISSTSGRSRISKIFRTLKYVCMYFNL